MSWPENIIGRILRDGGEAIIVDATMRTHYVGVDEHGLLIDHKRYEGAPGEVIPALAFAIEHGDDMAKVAGFTATDMN